MQIIIIFKIKVIFNPILHLLNNNVVEILTQISLYILLCINICATFLVRNNPV